MSYDGNQVVSWDVCWWRPDGSHQFMAPMFSDCERRIMMEFIVADILGQDIDGLA